MDAFRPPMAGNLHGALCPSCLTPHFPFCPTPFDRPRPPYLPHRPLPPGQPFGGMSEHPFRGNPAADPPPNLSNFPVGHNPPFPESFPSRTERFPQALQQSPLQFQSAEAFFSGPFIPSHVPARHPHFSHTGFQHPLAVEHRTPPGTLISGDPAGHRGANGWIELEKEREQELLCGEKGPALHHWFLGQQRRSVGMVDRLPTSGMESGDSFLPESLIARVPRSDDTNNVAGRMQDSGPLRLEEPNLHSKRDFGFRGEGLPMHGGIHRVGDGGKSGRYFKSQMIDAKKSVAASTGVKQVALSKDGTSGHEESLLTDTEMLIANGEQATKQRISRSGEVPNGEDFQVNHRGNKGHSVDETNFNESTEPNINVHTERKSRGYHLETRCLPQAKDFPQDGAGRPDGFQEGSFSVGRSQSFPSDVLQKMDLSKVSYVGPGQVNNANGFEGNKKGFGQGRKEPISREEELLLEHGLRTLERKEPMSREEELLLEHGLQDRTPERMKHVSREEEPVIELAVQKKTLKRKQQVSREEELIIEHGLKNGLLQKKQPMSREEELLMEHGLLDDNSDSPPRSPVHQPFVDQVRHLDGKSTFQNKQGLPRERQLVSSESSGYQHSFHQGRLEGEVMSSHRPVVHRDQSQRVHAVPMMQPFTRENEPVQKWEDIAERSSAVKSTEERVSSWPVKGFQKAEDVSGLSKLPAQPDPLLDMSQTVPSGESSYSRGWHLTEAGQSQSLEAQVPLPLQAGKAEQRDLKEAQQRKDFLHMQYEEWEAEQQHMEALKRAEEIAREIQQREENMQQTGFSQRIPLQDTHIQQQAQLEQRGHLQHFQLPPQSHPEQMQLWQQRSAYLQPEINIPQQNSLLQPANLSHQLYPAISDLLPQQVLVQQLGHFSQQPTPKQQVHPQELQLQKQTPTPQLNHTQQQIHRQHQTNFQQDSQHITGMQQTPVFYPQQPFHHLQSSQQQRSQSDQPLIRDGHEQQQRQLCEEQQPREHQDELEQWNTHLQWLSPQSQPPKLQLPQQHSIAQGSQNSSQFQQPNPQNLHPMPQQQLQQQQGQHHQQQQPTVYQPAQSHYFHPSAQGGSRTMSDGSVLSLSQPQETRSNGLDALSAISNQPFGVVNHYQSVASHEPHAMNFPPPLPSAASADPPPPTSPPPPPPPSGPPLPPPDAPLPPLPVSPLSRSAGAGLLLSTSSGMLTPSSSVLQPPFEAHGLSQNFQLQHAQNQPLQNQNPGLQDLHGFQQMGMHYMSQVPVGLYGNQLPQFPPKPPQQQEKSKVVDAVNIFRKPGRMTRPDRFVVILRGLPGSGKSYLAKALRDVEVMNGGSAPRIHSMDDYFMSEVEKVEDDETGTSSLRGRKKIVKKVMEYCYEPEMQEAYRASMLKAFRKTLEEGMFNFVIVDDRNVLVADFAQFWAIAKRSGYEVYVLEAPYKDATGCAARNVHNFTLEQVQSMAACWEPTPHLYLQLDVSSLFRGDDLNAEDITEVEMDADDTERDMEEPEENFQSSELGEQMFASSYARDNDKPSTGDRWEDKTDTSEAIRASPKSKRMSEDSSSDGSGSNEDAGNALSGLMMAYGKKDKFVRWADLQGGKGSTKGFSIGAAAQKKVHLVIGPGPGYNEVSNPVMEETDKSPVGNSHGSSEVRRNSKFLEQLRAEQEAFRAVFARRRYRIGGMDDDDD